MNERDVKKSEITQAGGKRIITARRKNREGTKMDAIRRGIDPLDDVNKYYINISVKFKLAKYALIFITVIFCIFMLTVYSEEITSERFRYMLRDFDFSDMTSGASYDSLVFAGGNEAKFGLYRDDLAVVTSDSTALYNSSGVQSSRHSSSFVNPVLLTSDKYMLVYDRGDASCTYTLYNSFSALKTENVGGKIYSAALSDSGDYVILMTDSTSKGIIRVYGSDLETVEEIRGDKYTVCAAISSDGKDIFVATLSDSNGDFVTELERVINGKTEKIYTANGKIIMSMQFICEDRIAMLFSDGVVICNLDGEVISELALATNLPTYSAFGDGIVCIVNNINGAGNDKTVSVYDGDGRQLYSGSEAGELISVKISGHMVYMLYESRISSINLDTGKSASREVNPNGKQVLVTRDGIILVCYSGSAVAVQIPE